jgi:hypothetical protein
MASTWSNVSGLAQVPLWRSDGKPPHTKDLAKIGMYAGVGIKNG